MHKLTLLLTAFTFLLVSCNKGKQQPGVQDELVDSLYAEFVNAKINESGKFEMIYSDFYAQTSSIKSKRAIYRRQMVEAARMLHVNQSDSAVNKLNELLVTIDTTTDQYLDLKLEVLMDLGSFFLRKEKKPKQAHQYFLKSVALAKKQNDYFNLAMLHTRLGYVYYNQQNYQLAKLEFKGATDVCNRYFNPDDNVYYYQEQVSNIGLCYYNLEQYDSALYYFDSTLSYIENKVKSTLQTEYYLDSRGVAQGNKAQVLGKLGKIDEAIVLLRENFNHLIKTVRYKHNGVAYYYELVGLKNLLNDPNIENYLDTLSTLYHQNPPELFFEKIHKLRADVLIKNDPNRAMEELKLVIAYQDSLYAANTENNFNIALTRQNSKNALEQLKVAEQQEELAKKQNQLYLLGILALVAILILGILLIVYQNRKNQVLKKQHEQITTQKQSLDEVLNEMNLANHEISDINDQKTKILGIVAHDLKNPIDAIISTVDLIESEDMSVRERQELLGLVKLSAESANQIMNELVIYSRLEKGQDFLEHFENTMVNDIVAKSIELHKLKLKEKNIKVEFKATDEIYAEIDPDKVLRVCNNLLNNAIKFSYMNESIKIKLGTNNGHVEISVQDNGIGIPRELQSILFSPFSNARRYGTSGERSTGLGLSIVKMIVQAHSGKVTFSSTHRQGTTFVVNLPVRQNQV